MIRNKLLLASAMTVALGFGGTAFAFQAAGTSIANPASTSYVKVATDQAETAKDFVQALANEGVGFLSDPNLSHEDRREKFKTLLNENFDIKYIGRFSLGRYWNQASEAQRTEYLNLFEKMIVNVYSKRFSEYDGQDLKITSARADGDTDAIVNSYINGKGQKVAVDWRVRMRNGQPKVIDVIVEGVSMATTQRSEFASIIQRGGGQIEALINHLDS